MNFKTSIRNNFLVGICLVLIGFGIFSSSKNQIVKEIPSPSPSVKPTLQFTIAKVTKVYDGDTIEIEGGVKVRYIGIDSPEVYPVKQCFSEDARRENEKLVLGKEVKLVKDISEIDKYGRLLSYVYVGDKFINDDLVRTGFAKVMTVPPDEKYEELFGNSESYAKENKLGLWSKCP